MTTGDRPEAGLGPEYRPLYRELQTRMSPGGDLAPGGADTFGRFRRGALWTPDRERMHSAILAEFRARCAGMPRDGHAALLTAGAPGAGKGGALRALDAWQGRDDELGRALRHAHGIDVRDYVVLDPDAFKVAIFEHGGSPYLPPHARELSDGRPLAPSETASLTHRESAFLQGVFEQWARSEGYNLLYDATLRDQHWNEKLLGDLRADGYDRRVLLSVEVPVEQCLAQNAGRWQQGRIEFDAGRDPYGGRMAPEAMIEDLYARGTSGRGFSVGRENAEKLVEGGLATALITSERGAFPTGPAPATAPGLGASAGAGTGLGAWPVGAGGPVGAVSGAGAGAPVGAVSGASGPGGVASGLGGPGGSASGAGGPVGAVSGAGGPGGVVPGDGGVVSGGGGVVGFRQGDATIRVATAARLRSGGGSAVPAAGRAPGTAGTTAPAAAAVPRAAPRTPRAP
ncbi:zeta toxin family protein [Streptomyces sp. NPDC127038]|uniref:zeta toxin family protein n=1 Tax=Streptomyces sp. NPDC127038 TaxID=3347114 RepID=UPI0036640354